MGNTDTASGPRAAIAEQRKFSALLKMLRAGLTHEGVMQDVSNHLSSVAGEAADLC